MKKTTALIMVLFIGLLALAACKDDKVGEPVTLESIKTALTDAGYTVIDDIDSLPENSVDGFLFAFNGAHGEVNIPVYEFKDKESANAYAGTVNTGGDWAAIVNDNFLTVGEAHHGQLHANEKTFLENLVNGKPLK